MIIRTDPLAALMAMAPSPTLRALTPAQRRALAGSKRFRAWMAGRRAGKSYAAAVWLLGGQKGQFSAYCSRTLKSAKAIMLGVFAELNAKFSLRLDIRASTGTIIEPSGHVIQLYGLRDQTQADLIRGQKFRRVFVDEGGAYTDELLKYCLEAVLQPTLLDLQGDMIVAGTPGPIPRGYFFDITGNPGLEAPFPGRWPTHHWTFRDNPHMPREAVLEEALTVNGWTETSPTFLREYGAIWCEDADALVYRYKPDLVQPDGVTPLWSVCNEPGKTVLAIDFGSGEKRRDATTWTVLRQPYNTQTHVFALHALARDEIELEEVAAITRQLRERFSVNKIVADEGALGKALAKALRSQYKLPIEAAVKQDKKGRILACRGRLAAQTFHICEEAKPLWDEWRTLCWNEARDDHHERQPDDISDGNLYGLEEFSGWQAEATPPKVVSLDEELRRKAMQRASQRGSRLGGSGGI
jgi:hypothetical protein